MTTEAIKQRHVVKDVPHDVAKEKEDPLAPALKEDALEEDTDDIKKVNIARALVS